MKIKRLFLFVLIGMLFLLTGCNKKTTTLIVATNCEFAPFEYVSNGEIKGFDMDLVRAYGEYANVNIEIQDMDFDGALLSVSTKKADMSIAGITVSETRKQSMAFTKPYYSADQVVIVKSNSIYKDLTNADDLLAELTKNKASIGCQRGTTGQYFIEGDADWDFEGIKDTKCVMYDNGALAVKALSDGKLDAVVIDREPAKLYIKSISNVEIIKDVILTQEEYAIAVNLNNQELLDSLNEFIDYAMNNQIMDDLVNKYFGDEDIVEASSVWNWNNFKQVLKGLANTFIITIVSFMLGILFGMLVSVIAGLNSKNIVTKVLKGITKGYVAIFRGTPIMVQLLIIYYVIFRWFTGDAIWVAMLAFGLNSGAYVSEIIRGGINAVPAGQMEAGRSLGLSYKTVMKKIVLPQAIKNCLPSLGNEFISLIKETSVVGFIGAFDLTLAFRKIANATYDYASTYLMMGLIYFVIVMLVTLLLHNLERRLAHDRIK